MPSFKNETAAQRYRAAFETLGWPLVALLFVALVLGGGGIRHGITNLVVQLAALAFLLFQPGLFARFVKDAPVWLKALVAATVLLPLLQLVPLPAGLWRGLPGRDLAAQSRDLIGAGGDWFPLSLDRARTVVALFALTAPLAVVVGSYSLGKNWRRSALMLLVGLAFLHFAFGVVQFAAGDALTLYETNDSGRFYGFFVGHISSGLFLVIGLCGLIGLFASKPRDRMDLLLYPAGALLLAIGVILSGSRSAVALLLVPGMWAAWLAWKETARYSARTRWMLVAAATLAVVVAGVFMASNQRLGATWERFQSFEDSRPDIWSDTLVGIDRYWPVGSGMGTFDEVFQVEESLETLPAKKAARAHNEYLEIALEAGIFGALLVAGWAIALLYGTYRGLRSAHAPLILAAALAMLCIALQALIYFPLRNMTVLCVAGLLVALLTAPVTIKRDRVIE